MGSCLNKVIAITLIVTLLVPSPGFSGKEATAAEEATPPDDQNPCQKATDIQTELVNAIEQYQTVSEYQNQQIACENAKELKEELSELVANEQKKNEPGASQSVAGGMCEYTLWVPSRCFESATGVGGETVFATLESNPADSDQCRTVQGRVDVVEARGAQMTPHDPAEFSRVEYDQTFSYKMESDLYPTNQTNPVEVSEWKLGLSVTHPNGMVEQQVTERATIIHVDPRPRYVSGYLELEGGPAERFCPVFCQYKQQCINEREVGRSINQIIVYEGNIKLTQSPYKGCVYRCPAQVIPNVGSGIIYSKYSYSVNGSLIPAMGSTGDKASCPSFKAKLHCDIEPYRYVGYDRNVSIKTEWPGYKQCRKYCPKNPPVAMCSYQCPKEPPVALCSYQCQKNEPVSMCQKYEKLPVPVPLLISAIVQPFCCVISAVCRCCQNAASLMSQFEGYVQEAREALAERQRSLLEAMQEAQRHAAEERKRRFQQACAGEGAKDGDLVNPADVGLDPAQLAREMGYPEEEIPSVRDRIRLRRVTVRGVTGFIIDAPGDYRFQALQRVARIRNVLRTPWKQWTPAQLAEFIRQGGSVQDLGLADNLRNVFMSCNGSYDANYNALTGNGYWTTYRPPAAPGEPRRFIRQYNNPRDSRSPSTESGIVGPDGRLIIQRRVYPDGTEIHHQRQGDTRLDEMRGIGPNGVVERIGWSADTSNIASAMRPEQEVSRLEGALAAFIFNCREIPIERARLRNPAFHYDLTPAQREAKAEQLTVALAACPEHIRAAQARLDEMKKELARSQANRRERLETFARNIIDGTSLNNRFNAEDKEAAIQQLANMIEQLHRENPDMTSVDIEVANDGTILLKPKFPEWVITRNPDGTTSRRRPVSNLPGTTQQAGQSVPPAVLTARFSNSTATGSHQSEPALVVEYPAVDPATNRPTRTMTRWREYGLNSGTMIERQIRTGTWGIIQETHSRYIYRVPYIRNPNTGRYEPQRREEVVEAEHHQDGPYLIIPRIREFIGEHAPGLLTGVDRAKETLDSLTPDISPVTRPLGHGGAAIGSAGAFLGGSVWDFFAGTEIGSNAELNYHVQWCMVELQVVRGWPLTHENITNCLQNTHPELVARFHQDLRRFVAANREETIQRMLLNSGNTDCLDVIRNAQISDAEISLHASSLGLADIIVREGSTGAFIFGTGVNVTGQLAEGAPLMLALGFVGTGSVIGRLIHGAIFAHMSYGATNNMIQFYEIMRNPNATPSDRSRIIASLMNDAGMFGMMGLSHMRSGGRQASVRELEQARSELGSKISELDGVIRAAKDHANTLGDTPAGRQLRDNIGRIEAARDLMQLGLQNLNAQITVRDPAKFQQMTEELARAQERLEQRLKDIQKDLQKKPGDPELIRQRDAVLNQIRDFAFQQGMLQAAQRAVAGEMSPEVETLRRRLRELEENREGLPEVQRRQRYEEALAELREKLANIRKETTVLEAELPNARGDRQTQAMQNRILELKGQTGQLEALSRALSERISNLLFEEAKRAGEQTAASINDQVRALQQMWLESGRNNPQLAEIINGEMARLQGQCRNIQRTVQRPSGPVPGGEGTAGPGVVPDRRVRPRPPVTDTPESLQQQARMAREAAERIRQEAEKLKQKGGVPNEGEAQVRIKQAEALEAQAAQFEARANRVRQAIESASPETLRDWARILREDAARLEGRTGSWEARARAEQLRRLADLLEAEAARRPVTGRPGAPAPRMTSEQRIQRVRELENLRKEKGQLTEAEIRELDEHLRGILRDMQARPPQRAGESGAPGEGRTVPPLDKMLVEDPNYVPGPNEIPMDIAQQILKYLRERSPFPDDEAPNRWKEDTQRWGSAIPKPPQIGGEPGVPAEGGPGSDSDIFGGRGRPPQPQQPPSGPPPGGAARGGVAELDALTQARRDLDTQRQAIQQAGGEQAVRNGPKGEEIIRGLREQEAKVARLEAEAQQRQAQQSGARPAEKSIADLERELAEATGNRENLETMIGKAPRNADISELMKDYDSAVARENNLRREIEARRAAQPSGAPPGGTGQATPGEIAIKSEVRDGALCPPSGEAARTRTSVTPQQIIDQWSVRTEQRLPDQFAIQGESGRPTANAEWVLFDVRSDPKLAGLINGARQRATQAAPDLAAPGALESRAREIFNHMRENTRDCMDNSPQRGRVLEAGPTLECGSVCRHQAPALAMALQRAGVNAVIRRGLLTRNGQTSGHMWVEITMPDGSIRIVDPTHGIAPTTPSLQDPPVRTPTPQRSQTRVVEKTGIDGKGEEFRYDRFDEPSVPVHVPPEGTSQPLCPLSPSQSP